MMNFGCPYGVACSSYNGYCDALLGDEEQSSICRPENLIQS